MKKVVLEILSDEIAEALQRMPADRLRILLNTVNTKRRGRQTLPSQMQACGMWKGRTDMKDSGQWVTALRKEWDKRLGELYGK